MKNIQNLKIVLAFAISFTCEIGKALEDNKFSLGESLGLVPDLFQIPSVIKAAKEIPAELGNLDEAERIELNDFIRTKFNLHPDAVESVIENAFTWLIATIGTVQNIRLALTLQP